MFTLTESREVHATPEQVYTVVADIRNYRHWNPWNVYASGEIFEGSLVDITAHMAGKKLQIRHKILRMQPNEVFAWCDTGWFTHFAYGERTRYISPSENGAHYRCELKISGIFSPFVKYFFARHIKRGMQSEADALKVHAEKAYLGR